MLKDVVGEINVRRDVYKGDEGFDFAVSEINQFYKKNGKIPTANDFASVVSAIFRGAWITKEIRTWNDFLQNIFGKLNNPMYIFR